jgi:hypothetical protein
VMALVLLGAWFGLGWGLLAHAAHELLGQP